MKAMNHNTHGYMYLHNTQTVCMQEDCRKHGIISRRLDEGSNNEVPITQILTSPTSQAGFTPNGKMHEGSVTAIITGALEKARYNTMKDNIKQRNSTVFSPTDRECLVMLNSDTLSSQFLTALPNATGIMPDKILIEVFAHSKYTRVYLNPRSYTIRSSFQVNPRRNSSS
jgi:hypothetical protein